jgi:hypothetical protein
VFFSKNNNLIVSFSDQRVMADCGSVILINNMLFRVWRPCVPLLPKCEAISNCFNADKGFCVRTRPKNYDNSSNSGTSVLQKPIDPPKKQLQRHSSEALELFSSLHINKHRVGNALVFEVLLDKPRLRHAPCRLLFQ